ncbi:MAG: hypothetical protein Q8R98_18320 [Rubrivivax sp.]|nr:hypothetical protein [Rubrivivax sp.]
MFASILGALIGLTALIATLFFGLHLIFVFVGSADFRTLAVSGLAALAAWVAWGVNIVWAGLATHWLLRKSRDLGL